MHSLFIRILYSRPQNLMSAFHCREPESRRSRITALVASFQTYDVFFKIEESTGEDKDKAGEENVSSYNAW